MKAKYTVCTRLRPEHNSQIIEYFNDQHTQYNYVFRKVFHAMRAGTLDDIKRGDTPELRLSNFCAEIQQTYGISKRTANSIIKQAKGQLLAIAELKQLEKSNHEIKLKAIDEKIKKLEHEVFIKRTQAKQGKLDNKELEAYRNHKKWLFNLRRVRQKRVSSLNDCLNQIETGKYNICFGTKKLAKKSHDGDKEKTAFLFQRDRRMCYVGAKGETSCNQQLQLFYDKKINQFFIKLRKDFDDNKSASGGDRYAIGKCYFKHHKDKIIEVLTCKTSPLSYKLIEEKDGLYLHLTFEIDIKRDDMPKPTHGSIGIDMNENHFSVSEIDTRGVMVSVRDHYYRSKQGNKTLNDMRQFVNTVVKQAKAHGRLIVIENLDFADEKQNASKSKLKHEKKYNHMLHNLSYSRFDSLIVNACMRHKVLFTRVNPAWTSKIGKALYCDSMKLSIHQAASFLIARRGLGIKDKMPPKSDTGSELATP